MENLPPLWEHQSKAVAKSDSCPDMALFMDVGTGKTRTQIEIIRKIFNRRNNYVDTLIVCPSSVVPNWKIEIQKYSKIPASKIILLNDSMSLVERGECYLNNGPCVFVVNCEAFAFDSFVSRVLKKPPAILIVDESHRFKNFTAKRTKALLKLTNLIEKLPEKNRFILTGSPVVNDHLDLFSQFYILDAGRTFGTNYYAFRATYFAPIAKKVSAQRTILEWKPKVGIEAQLKALMSAKTVIAKKDECLDLPPLIHVDVEVSLGKEQEKAYKEMKRDFLAVTESGVGVAQIALTKMLRMSQILSGFLKLDDSSIHHFKENPRAQVLSDLLEDITPSEKVIVWSIFHEDFTTIKKICEKLGLKYAEVTGLVKDKQKELDMFENDPECRVMIASQAAGGTGINMIAASAAIYYSRGYNFEHDLQSEARNYRGGSERHKKVTRYNLVARKTIDEIIAEALRNKKDLSTNILELREILSRM